MPTIKLTQAAIERLKPPATGRVEYWDSQLPGFGLRIAAPRPGRSEKDARRTWQAFYRVKGDGTVIRETIGTAAVIPNVADARARARASIDAARQGINPIARRRDDLAMAQREAAQREIETLGAALDRYTTKLPTLGNGKRRTRPRRPEYVAEVKRCLERDVRDSDKVGADRPLRGISKKEISALLDEIAARAPSHANHVLSYFRAFMNWAVSEDLIDANPAAQISAPSPFVDRDRALDDDEIRLFWLGCDKIGEPFGPLFKLLLLTAQRRDELAHATWLEFDLDKAMWTLRGERTKNGKAHEVHLSPPAIELLSKLPKVGEKRYLFSTTGKTPVSGFGRARERLAAAMANIRRAEQGEAAETIEPFTLHDLRRSAATGMASIGIAHHVLDKILNHSSGKISGVGAIYNRFEYKPERNAALEAWARHIEGLVSPTTSNVVPIKSAG
ncbi:MAG TPA: site-specific integrase [Stellaceae bacterium]|nr:site-specific integrase [Stellaceae bacterium]